MNESAWLFVKMLKQISKGWRIESQQSSVEDLMNKLFLRCSKGSPNSALWERKGDQTSIRLKLISKAILRVYGCELDQKTPGNICTPWVPWGRSLKPLKLLANLTKDVAGDVCLGSHSAVPWPPREEVMRGDLRQLATREKNGNLRLFTECKCNLSDDKWPLNGSNNFLSSQQNILLRDGCRAESEKMHQM